MLTQPTTHILPQIQSLPQAMPGKIPLRFRREICGEDYKFLRRRSPVDFSETCPKKRVRVADFFCGAGGLSLGLHLAAAELGLGVETCLAVDSDPAALACYSANFPNATTLQSQVEALLSPDLDRRLTDNEKRLQDTVGDIDILAGGPPCQGHSDLNNYTRRDDPKNRLFIYMARAAIVLRPKAVLIENVLGSLHDRGGVVQKVLSLLRSQGFYVDCDFLDFLQLGVPQRRRRLVITASRAGHSYVRDVQRDFSLSHRPLKWAIGDIEDEPADCLMTKPSNPTQTTRKRIDYLFRHGLYELPNSQRPSCHKHKAHSYDTVYGRLRWNLPAQTLTSGFYCMCMGRYVHPSRPRTLTAHEAARIQFFPDYFDFTAAKNRTKIAELIGNAVPPKGAYAVGLDLIRALTLARI